MQSCFHCPNCCHTDKLQQLLNEKDNRINDLLAIIDHYERDKRELLILKEELNEKRLELLLQEKDDLIDFDNLWHRSAKRSREQYEEYSQFDFTRINKKQKLLCTRIGSM
ncbi:60 kDa chaperonin [Acrasis kona]|uniref:60 kDa chaperonin n=1 Tax=Acrasis kona TaxID=1008807 RepID=A0AAW2Z2L1_9EUKA